VRIPKPDVDRLFDEPVFCVHCDHPLSPKDNGFLLKYLMVGRPNERHRA
jgi:prepilin signal peptidase PulO-like enzyme (type II secretory pathway)